MTPKEQATRLLAKCRRRMSGVEIQLCERIVEGDLDDTVKQSPEDPADSRTLRDLFRSLTTEFAADLA
jgi:hypothetical protein